MKGGKAKRAGRKVSWRRIRVCGEAVFLVLACMICLNGLLEPAKAQQPPATPLAGKTITIVVGVQAGGTSDIFVRGFIPFWKRHTPGQPNFLVQFMPGAGGILATNHLAEVARPDGLTLGFGPLDPLAQVLGNQGLRTRYDKLELVGGFADTRIVYARTDVIPGGLKQPADIVKAPFVNIGSFNATDVSGLMAHLALDTLGVKHRIITGYRGGNDILLAVQRNEVQFHSTSIGTLRTRGGDALKNGTLIEIGYLVPVDAHGKFKPNPHIAEMPPFPEVVRQATGKAPEGASWEALNWLVSVIGPLTFAALAPPKTPQAVLEPLRQGFEAALGDPEFMAQSTKINGMPYAAATITDGQAVMRSLNEISPGVLSTLRSSVEALGR